MNKIFKVVWSKVRNAYVVVSEIAKNTVSGVGKRNRVNRFSLGATLAALALTSSFFVPNGAWAAESALVGAQYYNYIAIAASYDGYGNLVNPFGAGTNITTDASGKYIEVVVGDNTYKYIYTMVDQDGVFDNNTSDDKAYWIRDGFGVKAITERYHPSATNVKLDLYKIPGTNATYDNVSMSGAHTAEITSVKTAVNDVALDKFVFVQYAAMTNAGGIDTPSGWNYYINRVVNGQEQYIDVGGNNFNNNFYEFKAGEFNAITGKYTFKGKDVEYENVYKVGGKIGVFLTNSASNASYSDITSSDLPNNVGVYGGAVYGANNEILLSGYDSEANTWSTVWAGEVTDPYATVDSMTLSEFNEILEHLHKEDVKLANADIVGIKAIAGSDSKSGTINLVNQSNNLTHGLTITSSGGTSGKDTRLTFNGTGSYVDADGYQQTYNDSFTLETGSKVVANGGIAYSTGQQLTSLTINGNEYIVSSSGNNSGTAVISNITLTEGDNIDIVGTTNNNVTNYEITATDTNTTYTVSNGVKDGATGNTVYTITDDQGNTVGHITDTDTDTNTLYVVKDGVKDNTTGNTIYKVESSNGNEYSIIDTNNYVTKASIVGNNLVLERVGLNDITVSLAALRDGLAMTDMKLISNPDNSSNGTYTVDADGNITLKVSDGTNTSDVVININNAKSVVTGTGEANVTSETITNDGHTVYNVYVKNMRVKEGSATYLSSAENGRRIGDGDVTLTNYDSTTAEITGLHDYYAQSLAVATEGEQKNLVLTLNNGENVSVALSDITAGLGTMSSWKAKVGDTTFDVENNETVEYVAGENIKLDVNADSQTITVSTKAKVGFDEVTVGSITDNSKVVINDAGLAMGNQKITGLQAGTADTDAVNVSQLNAVSATMNKGWNLKVTNSDSFKVVPDGDVTLKSANDNLQITNANGVVTFTAKDDFIGTAGFNNDTGTLTLGYDGNGKTALTVAGLMNSWNAKVDGTTLTVGNKDVVSYIAGNNIDLTIAEDTTNGGGSITVATDNIVTFDSVTVNGSATGNNVVINSSGINAGNKVITNVANGNVAQSSTEAVNGGQLWTAQQQDIDCVQIGSSVVGGANDTISLIRTSGDTVPSSLKFTSGGGGDAGHPDTFITISNGSNSIKLDTGSKVVAIQHMDTVDNNTQLGSTVNDFHWGGYIEGIAINGKAYGLGASGSGSSSEHDYHLVMAEYKNETDTPNAVNLSQKFGDVAYGLNANAYKADSNGVIKLNVLNNHDESDTSTLPKYHNVYIADVASKEIQSTHETEITQLQADRIKDISITSINGGGTIGLNRVGTNSTTKSVDGTITVTAIEGSSTGDAQLKFSNTISGTETFFAVNVGSTVRANNDVGASTTYLDKISVNGTPYKVFNPSDINASFVASVNNLKVDGATYTDTSGAKHGWKITDSNPSDGSQDSVVYRDTTLDSGLTKVTTDNNGVRTLTVADTAGNSVVLDDIASASAVNQRFDSIEGNITSIQGDISNLTTDVSNIRGDISNLTTDVTNIRTDISNLTTDVTNIRTDISNLTTDVTNIRGDINNLSTDVTNIRTDITNITGNQITSGSIANYHYDSKAGGSSSITLVTESNSVDDIVINGLRDTTLVADDNNEGVVDVNNPFGKTYTISDTNNNSVVLKDVASASKLKEVSAKVDVNTKTINEHEEKISDNTKNIGILVQYDQAIINYANNQTQYLDSRINQVNSRVNKVGAGAAALAALHPMDFDPDDKLSFAVGAGNYAGENATALGAFYRPNEKVMMSVGGTYGNGENMVNMGVSFALDRTNNISNSRTAMAKEIVDLRSQVATQGQQIAQLVDLVNKLVGANAVQNPAEIAFPDVPQNHWAYEYVNGLVAKGIIEGYPDGTFGGDRVMTRYEFAAMLFRAMEQGVVLNEQIRQEFEPELGRIRVDRVKGTDADLNKIERVRVNTAVDRDDYGSKVVQVKH